MHAIVERAGVCAEGDNCLRWRCSACAAYWLGDPLEHLCPSPVALEGAICARVDQALAHDADLATSARTVLRRLRDEGFGHVLLDTFGERLIASLWRGRHPPPITPSLAPMAIPRTPMAGASTTTTAHRRPASRAQFDALSDSAAVLEALVKVGGRWLRFGDLDRAHCRALASDARHKADFFACVGAALLPGQRVRERWSASDLARILAEASMTSAAARDSDIERVTVLVAAASG